ncbi:hypothetical protein BV20DRAFT_1115693 [Pilatotrama ljubarskyi]|nr:hypothetical protein BV20DRAFT_1115693 [Pilatotrama ljubarskyi]
MVSSSRPRQTQLSFPSLSQNPSKGKVAVKASPQSTVPQGRTITRNYARNQYRVTNVQLNKLATRDVRYINNQVDAVDVEIFQEQDVERIAWEHRGGKRGFIAYLKERRDQRRKNAEAKLLKGRKSTASQRKKVPLPEAHQPAALSPRLARIQEATPPWLWDRCSRHLDPMDEALKLSGQGELPLEERETLMAAAEAFAKKYPARPTVSLDPSQQLKELREVLESSPQAPSKGSHGWGRAVDGLEIYRRRLSRDQDAVPVYASSPLSAPLWASTGWTAKAGRPSGGRCTIRRVLFPRAVHSIISNPAAALLNPQYMARIGPPIFYSPKDACWTVDPGLHWLQSHAYLYRGLHKYRDGAAVTSPTLNSSTMSLSRHQRLSYAPNSPWELQRARSMSPPQLAKLPTPPRARSGPSSI